MALPTFDSAKHHIGLKERGGATLFGFMLEGAYSKVLQREAMGAQEFGGASDTIGMVPSVSRWTQDDFVGGMFAYNWGRDDAMFADCTGFIPMPQARSLQSCPPLFLKKAIDSDGQAGWTTDIPRSMFMVGGSIYTQWPHTISRYRIDVDTNTFFNVTAGYVWAGAEYNSVDQVIWAARYDGVDLPVIDRIKTDLSGYAAFDAFYTGPAGTEKLSVYGFTIFNQQIVMQVGRKIWVGDPPDNPTPTSNDDNVVWTKIGVLPGRWRDSVAYQRMLYILINDGSFKSNVFAFTGTSLEPVCQLPFNFYAKCMTEYAGRIYVGGTGTDVNGGEHYAELYEITGASVRLVRSFSPETRHYFLGGIAGEWPNSFDDLTVFEGMLWMSQKGKRLIAYDVTSDGFFGAAEIQSNADLGFPRLISGRGRIWGYGVDDSADANHGIYRIAQPADTIAAWNPTLITSDFAYEPAMKKRWGKLRVHSRYGSVEAADYSINSGETWTALTPSVSATYGKVYYSDMDLAAIAPSEHIRFRIKLTDTGEAGDARTYHRELVAITMSFVMLDTGKHAWTLTLNGSQEIETRDAILSEATTQAYDVSEFRDQVWSWADNKTNLTYRDVDDVEYDVSIVDCRESQPVVGQDASGENEPEALYVVTLLEV